MDESMKRYCVSGEYSVTSPEKPRGRGKSKRSIALIEAARDWLETAHPTSVRGVCYYLFTIGIIDSMAKNNTSKVSRLLTDAREAGVIPWEWIVDETRDMERAASWANPAQYVQAVRQSYRRDFWMEQRHDVEVWSEKGTIRGVLAPVLNEYGVGFRVMHGFSGATTVHDIATGPGSLDSQRPLNALYVGDWDPSGLYMSEHDLPGRLQRYGDRHVRMYRVALREQDLAGLPSFNADTKRGDPRYRWFTEHYGDECWEIDAMDPNALRESVRETIEYYISDRDAWERCERAQEAEQKSLQTALDSWTALKKGTGGPP